MRTKRWTGGLAACLLVIGAAAAQDDPAKALRSRDVQARLAAVQTLASGAHEQAEALLLRALADDDWEVSEAAARALAEPGGADSIAPLVKASLQGPTRRARRAAALSLAAIDAKAAAVELAKRVGKADGLQACEALAVVAPADASGAASKALVKALESTDAALRAAAARGIAGLGDESRTWLERLLGDASFEVRAAALRAVGERPQLFGVEPLLAALDVRALPDVLERRLAAAVSAWAAASTPEAARAALEPWLRLDRASPETAARRMRLAGALARNTPALAELVGPCLDAGLAHADAGVRAAALHAGARFARAETLAAAPALAREDASPRVRRLALHSLARAHAIAADEALRALVMERLADDGDASVREAAAVALGARGVQATPALTAALADPDWAVAVCAAVSLGKTRDVGALEPLVALASHADWRRRGAAVVGLTHLGDTAAVPALIAALADPEPAVKKSAHVCLESVTHAGLPEATKPWLEWWKEHGAGVRFPDPEEVRKRREKYGYAQRDEEVFQDLDVVVLESRGDQIQLVLERLKIGFRTTVAARVQAAALHPGAIYASNCTGEVEAADLERIGWFVRTGGYLFGSCWSLSQTIEPLFPGSVRQFETGAGDVMDDVTAEATAADSPYLKGVLGAGWTPIYHLEGAHLIEVVDPERCEVLMDSVDCLQRWGSGNLAVWFPAGHGLVLDSVNHFALQGLEVAPGVKTDDERMAFAIDHLGLDYATWRATRKEKWWGNALKASQNVFDLSAFRFVTNFVREKRLADG